jgi:hypothetical protein
MERWKQYGTLTALVVAFAGLGYVGFVATGGALPYGKRFAQSIQRGVETGGGSLVDLGRGIVLAGPIRSGGMVLEFLLVLAAFVLAGIGLYVYGDRLADGGR